VPSVVSSVSESLGVPSVVESLGVAIVPTSGAECCLECC
jgi:hypothetical protein